VSKFHDDRTAASDPGGVHLSREKFHRLEPLSAGRPAAWAQRFGTREKFEEMLDEHLRLGDSRAACVLSVEPLLVAAYTDELDCVAVLRFPFWLVADHNLKVDDRLLTVNTYSRGGPVAPDLQGGPKQTLRYGNFYPVVAEFVSEHARKIARRKAEIAEGEWARCLRMGREYLSRHPGRCRDGSPFWSNQPAAGPPAGVVAAPAAAAPGAAYGIVEQPAGEGNRCPGCGAGLSARAVLCVRCGYDFRLGKSRATVKGKAEAPARVAPRTWAQDFPRVLRGLTLHNARILLSLIAVVLLFGSTAAAATKLRAGAQEPPAWLLLPLLGGVGVSLVSILLGFVGSIFCLRVPRESAGRLPLALSLAFDVAAMPLGVVAAILGWTPLLSWATGICSWILFLAFLVRLASYMDRPSEAREAKGILLFGLGMSILPATLAVLSFLWRDPTSVYVVAGFLLIPVGIWYFRLQIALYKLLETLRASIRQQIDDAERELKRQANP
jgi:hypothetical protein